MKGLFVPVLDYTESCKTGGHHGHMILSKVFQKALSDDVSYVMIPTPISKVDVGNIIYKLVCQNKYESFLNFTLGYCTITPKMEKELLKFIKDYDIDFVLFSGSTFGRTTKKIKKQSPNTKVLCYMHNIEKNYARKLYKREGIFYSTYYLATCINEKMAVKYADKVINLNKRDADLLFEEYGRKSDMIIPVLFEDDYDENKHRTVNKKDYLLFVGALFGPNEEGIRWFIDNVMPESKLPLKVVGKGFEKIRDELTKDNVEVIGTVDDLSVYYNECLAMVMPIPYGDGMKVKTAEAMMYGKTILASTEALEGYHYDGVDGIFCCNTKEEYLDVINNHTEQLENFKRTVRDNFVENYNLDAYVDEFRNNIYE